MAGKGVEIEEEVEAVDHLVKQAEGAGVAKLGEVLEVMVETVRIARVHR